MAEPENVESEVFDSLLPTLTTGLAQSVATVAQKCFAKRIITRDVYNSATGRGLTPNEKAEGLLNALSSSIETNPESFYTFVAILKAEAVYKHLGDKLRADVDLRKAPKSKGITEDSDKTVGTGVHGKASKEAPELELDEHWETVDNTTILSIDDWDEVNRSMQKIRREWFEIGIGLKVDKAFLEELEDKRLAPERMLNKMLGEWLVNYNEVKLGGKPTWRMLARTAGEHQMDVAREIARNHPATQQQQPQAGTRKRPHESETEVVDSEPKRKCADGAGNTKPKSILDETPTLNDLLSFEWINSEGKLKQIRVLDKFAVKWKNLGMKFGFDVLKLAAIERNKHTEEDRFENVIEVWLTDNSYTNYAVTWRGLIEALRACNVGQVVDELQLELALQTIKPRES